MIPQAYGYPAALRATRDLLRRRCHRVQKRAELLAHMQNTTSPYNLPEIGKKLAYQANREGVEEHCPAPRVRKPSEVARARLAHSDPSLREMALSITRRAQVPDGQP